MLILKLMLKIMCFPVILVCLFLKWTAIAAMVCGAYVLSPVMLFLLACAVYTIFKQTWSQTLLLGILELCCVAILVGATWIAALADSVLEVLQ